MALKYYLVYCLTMYIYGHLIIQRVRTAKDLQDIFYSKYRVAFACVHITEVLLISCGCKKRQKSQAVGRLLFMLNFVFPVPIPWIVAYMKLLVG